MTTYTSKLTARQTAWFMRENKAVALPIGSVIVQSTVDEKDIHTLVQYGFAIYEDSPLHRKFKEWLYLYEKYVFATKEELLASL